VAGVARVWRLGIIGFGWAGEQHARALGQLRDRAELAGIAEIAEPVARRAAQDWGAPFWTTDYRALLSGGRCEAVSICLPHQLHAAVALEAAQAGLHVLVEKPLASSLAEADAMIAAAKAAGVRLMVAENVRYDTLYRKAAEIAASGELGQIYLVRIAREHNMREYLHKRPWFLADGDAGIMTSGGIHDFELLRMLAGEIAHVYALQGSKAFPEMRADDNAVALAGMQNGAAAVLVETFSLRTPRPGVACSVHGSLGSLWLEAGHIRVYTAEQDGQPHLAQTVEAAKNDTFVAEIAHFLDCLDRPDTEPLTSGQEARKPLAAVLAAYESMRTGQRVDLSSFTSVEPVA
jgi:predicted dehydrogenase